MGMDGAAFLHISSRWLPTVLQSARGRYFLGRTGLFAVPAGHEALVLFANPPDGGRRAFLVAITLTSNQGRRASFRFDAATSAPLQASPKVAIAHRGVPDTHRVEIRFGAGATLPVTAGVDAFSRLLEGRVTLTTEQEGRFIFEPGHSIGVQFSPIESPDELDVAFGWWEEPGGLGAGAHVI